jgi:hypothetical protein
MPFIEVEAAAGENNDMALNREFDAREDPYPVTTVVALRRDGSEGLCAVT